MLTVIFIIVFVLQLFTLSVGWLLLKSTKQGAQTTIHLAVSEDVRGISGMFVVVKGWFPYNCKPSVHCLQILTGAYKL